MQPRRPLQHFRVGKSWNSPPSPVSSSALSMLHAYTSTCTHKYWVRRGHEIIFSTSMWPSDYSLPQPRCQFFKAWKTKIPDKNAPLFISFLARARMTSRAPLLCYLHSTRDEAVRKKEKRKGKPHPIITHKRKNEKGPRGNLYHKSPISRTSSPLHVDHCIHVEVQSKKNREKKWKWKWKWKDQGEKTSIMNSIHPCRYAKQWLREAMTTSKSKGR